MSLPATHRSFRRAVWAAAIIISGATIALSSLIGSGSYALASIVVVLCALAPTFIIFEHRRPRATEIALIAVMCALAIIARVAFAALPNFKPTAGVIMICGMALGSGPGFLAGALTMLISDLVFGMGPWAPWQMLSIGLCGAFGGTMGRWVKCGDARMSKGERIGVSVGCGAFVLFVAGPILDTSTLFYMISTITVESVIAVYAAGVPLNLLHALATFFTVLIVGPPLLHAFAYVRKRYGLF